MALEASTGQSFLRDPGVKGMGLPCLYDAAESFHVLHMDPMSDDAVSNQLLSPHLCPSMPLFGPGWAKVWHIAAKTQAKLMLFGGMSPNMMLLNHSMSSIWSNE
jgi:hypothetical protein